MRVLSGIQPSGALHLGNYFAMMKRMIELQQDHELFAPIVNYHALTTQYDAAALRRQTLQAAVDFLALGLDPKRAVIWVQSDLPEVQELTWFLSNVTGMGLLERSHAYKDKVAKGMAPTHGLFAYPVLMAADILICGAERVPVGKDQKQHVEMARDIAIRFNNTYGETFVIPEADIAEEVATVPGIDGQKMSKSYGNTIELFAPEAELKQRVMSIKTDSTPVNEPKPTKGNPLFEIYSQFLDEPGRRELKERFESPGLKYGEVKKELFGVIWEYFAPYRQKRQELFQDQAMVADILQEGAQKARQASARYMELAKHRVGVDYRNLEDR